MGRRYRLFIEGLEEGRWVDAKIGKSDIRVLLRNGYKRWLEYTFLDVQSVYDFGLYNFVEEIFIGKNAIFRFKNGIPDDASSKLITRITNNAYAKIWWYNVGELLIGDWSETQTFVSTSVSKEYVEGFGDGSHLFSRDELQKVYPECVDKDVWVGYVATEGINYYSNPTKLYQNHYNKNLQVTWKMSLSEYFPGSFMALLKYLEARNKVQELRLYLVNEK